MSGKNQIIQRPFHHLGDSTIQFVREIGAMAIFFALGVRHIFSTPKQIPRIVEQMYNIGAKSVFVISLISIFTGMVMGLQGYYTLVRFGSEGMLGTAVALTIIRELGPVLTAIMVTARAGSSMAAEIGVMRITDQIDALEVMDINPIVYLFSPRLAASLMTIPLLTALFDVIGIIGGYLTGVVLLGINSAGYFARIHGSVTIHDVSSGFVKSVVFAGLIATICCFQGFFTHMQRDAAGPQAVSNSTTTAVVLSCVCTLIADYVLTSFML